MSKARVDIWNAVIENTAGEGAATAESVEHIQRFLSRAETVDLGAGWSHRSETDPY